MFNSLINAYVVVCCEGKEGVPILGDLSIQPTKEKAIKKAIEFAIQRDAVITNEATFDAFKDHVEANLVEDMFHQNPSKNYSVTIKRL